MKNNVTTAFESLSYLIAMRCLLALRFPVLPVLCCVCGGCAELAGPWPPAAGPLPPANVPREDWRVPPAAQPPRRGRDAWVPEPAPERPAAGRDYVVRLREGMSAGDFARRHGLNVQGAMRSDPSTIIFRGSAGPGVLERLQRDPSVIQAEPDGPSQNVPMSH